MSDKTKTFAVKAELEATLGTPALSGKVQGGVDMNKSEMKTSTETTVTVNWSGGGQIKPSDAIWDVNSLTLAAANFPDLVAKTPQRTYAILSKYTSLKSFLRVYQPSSVLTYENAGVYTSALLDMYMDYKSIWKQIQIANFELKNRRADIRAAKPPAEVAELALARRNAQITDPKTIGSIPIDKARGITNPTLPPALSSQDQSKRAGQPSIPPTGLNIVDNPTPVPHIPDMIDFVAYKPTVLGLDRARRDCRNEMIKIVSEVRHYAKVSFQD